ncbi:hypothetical protein KVR01_004730 [Diaporthe batatas]|uniref:uncharacterized protein n=1 Tax=Diaporthe batatas TaxID=748121 RepID=UPI001D03F3FE|nr:uncharacterized protein KVR01_004730 [Diaporthe batatas]KAG8166178.1 hypothetical protein KVR01_004730 [Diaporthe batatas]
MFRLYEVDPDADTLIIIPTPSKSFAPWEETPPPSDASSVYAGILRGTSRPPNTYASIASAPEVRVKVSSRHLGLASKHFRNKFRHENPVEADGRVHVTLGGYDPKAVIVVMDAVHGRGRKVPRSVDLELLAKIAVFVDAFKFHEAVEVYAERWFEGLGGALPTKYGRDLVLWIYASYVFRQQDVFKRVSNVAILQSNGPIRSLGLQLRDGLIREIDRQRQQLVRQALDVVYKTIDSLQVDETPCPRGCDTFLLGSLVKSLRRHDLTWPRPSRPFIGVSFVGISQSVGEAGSQLARLAPGLSLNGAAGVGGTSRKRKTPNSEPKQTLTPDSSPELRATLDAHDCGVGAGLADKLDELGAGVTGLELESRLGYLLY